MGRVLVLGGTGWLGRAIAQQQLAEGNEVTCLARGESGPVPEGARLIAADRRNPEAYEQVVGEWDEVIELAYAPELVVPALDALAARAAHWTLMSTVSVYARTDRAGADESAPLVEPSDLTQYPDAKVAAERASADRLAGRLLVVRPGLIVGAGDPSDRFGYWPARMSRGGRVLVPRAEGRYVQVIDVVDLAAWVVRAGTARLGGVVDAVGASLPLAEVLRCVATVSGFRGRLIPLSDADLLHQDVHYWAGPRSLPLWLPVEDAAFAQRSSARFLEHGGTARPLADTVADVLADEVARGVSRVRRSGLSAEEEADVLRAALG